MSNNSDLIMQIKAVFKSDRTQTNVLRRTSVIAALFALPRFGKVAEAREFTLE
jgi:hypothetical protein